MPPVVVARPLAFTAAKPTSPAGLVPLEDTALDDELLGGLMDELEDELAGALLELDDLLALDDCEELDELLPGTEHSSVPPVTRPPKVASLQTKLPVSTL